jgi:hypothetical protein
MVSGRFQAWPGGERLELEAVGVQSLFEQRVVVAWRRISHRCRRGARRISGCPVEAGLLVVFADPAAVAGSAVLPAWR